WERPVEAVRAIIDVELRGRFPDREADALEHTLGQPLGTQPRAHRLDGAGMGGAHREDGEIEALGRGLEPGDRSLDGGIGDLERSLPAARVRVEDAVEVDRERLSMTAGPHPPQLPRIGARL